MGLWGELVVVGTIYVGQISCIHVWVLHLFPALDEKAPLAAVKDKCGQDGEGKGGGDSPILNVNTLLSDSLLNRDQGLFLLMTTVE